MQDVIDEICRSGYEIKAMSQDEMINALQAALTDENKSNSLIPLLAYANNNDIEPLGLDDADGSYRLDVHWSETCTAYIRKFVANLRELLFFE